MACAMVFVRSQYEGYLACNQASGLCCTHATDVIRFRQLADQPSRVNTSAACDEHLAIAPSVLLVQDIGAYLHSPADRQSILQTTLTECWHAPDQEWKVCGWSCGTATACGMRWRTSAQTYKPTSCSRSWRLPGTSLWLSCR